MLYARSVRRNILYGLEEEDGESPGSVPSMDDVEQAARLANAHGFISDWPEGYETVWGIGVLHRLNQKFCLPLHCAGQSILSLRLAHGKRRRASCLQDCGEKGATISGGQRQR